MAQIACK